MKFISHIIGAAILQTLMTASFLSLHINASTNPYVGEIGWTTASVAPDGWAFCDGQLLYIANYPQLFSLIGTQFGGDGRSTFGLPDLRGRMAIGTGTGPNLSQRLLGNIGGAEQVQLTTANMPPHNHQVRASLLKPITAILNNTAFAGILPRYNLQAPNNNDALNDNTVSEVGGGVPQPNLMPSVALNCIIALTGQVPSDER